MSDILYGPFFFFGGGPPLEQAVALFIALVLIAGMSFGLIRKSRSSIAVAVCCAITWIGVGYFFALTAAC
jgi:hypothetical protein